MLDLIRFYNRWARCGRRFLACSVFLAPLAVRAQPSAALLQEKTSIEQPEAFPVITREGVCLAWRTQNEIFASNAQGQKGATVAGNSLKVSVSGNGAAFAILEKVEEKQQPALRLRWFERNSRPRSSHVMAWHADHPLPQFCFNTAATRLLVADPAVARLTILSAEGQVVREIDLFNSLHYVNERPLFLSASAEEFLVLTQAFPAAPQNSSQPVLICLNSAGRERWRQELQHGTSAGLAVSEEGRWILAGSYEVVAPTSQVRSVLQFFDRNGKLLLAREGLFRQALFAQNSEQVLVLDRRLVRLLRLPGGELLWQSNLSLRSEMFVTAATDASGENIFALIATSTFKNDRFVFEKARLVKFDAAGRSQHAATMNSDLIEPSLAMTRDGKQLVLAANGALRYYALKETKIE